MIKLGAAKNISKKASGGALMNHLTRRLDVCMFLIGRLIQWNDA